MIAAPRPPAPPPTAASRRRGVLVVQGGLLLMWLLAFELARVLEHTPHASLWFPPSAVTLAALVVLGLRAVPVLVIACIAATFLTELSYRQELGWAPLLLSCAVFGTTHVGAYGLVAALLRALGRDGGGHEITVKMVAAFLLFGAIGAGTAAMAGAHGLALTGMIDTEPMAAVVVPWWIGDYVAIVTLAPLGMALLAGLTARAGVHAVVVYAPFAVERLHLRPAALAKLGLLLAASASSLFGYAALPDNRALLFTLFLPVVLQMWIVHTEDRATSMLSVCAFSLLVVAGAAVLPSTEDALVLQFAVIALAANSWFGLAVPALYAANVRLQDQLSHDRLTGALSRASFEERAAEAIRRARRSNRPATVVMLDLDDLKRINDEHGHAAGDRALRALAERVTRCLHAADLFGRLSGDEFALLLVDTDLDGAERRIAAMRRELAGTAAELGIEVATSAGCATVEAGADRIDQLLLLADRAMYADKLHRRRPAASPMVEFSPQPGASP